jgi:MoaA/NifB/PqqE/SkfB family radical SAM enzyme
MAEHKALPKAKIQISTNGLLPERAIKAARYALQNNINIDVGTSLDGIGEKHDFARGVSGSFEKTDKMLQEMIKLQNEYGKERIDISFGFTLTDYTASSLKEVTEYSKKRGVPFLVQWFNRSSFYNNEDKDGLDKRTEQKAVRSLPFSIVREMWLRWLNGKSIKFPCFAMYTFCVLKCNGDISPCLSLWDVNAGNVREKSPTQIWLSHEAREARKTVKDCQGCLNSWGTGWSFMNNCYIHMYYLRHLGSMVKRFKEA